MAVVALEQFVAQVRTFSAESNFASLADLVRKAIPAVLLPNLQYLDNMLPTFDLQQHSSGILAILYAKLSSNSFDFETLMAMIQEFLSGFNSEQIRYVPEIFCDLCHRFTACLVNKREPLRGIFILSKAIERFQISPGQLTSVHADLCQLCLLAKNFKPALKFLDIDITDIAKEGNGFDAKYFLLYYYYGGMIYASLKNYLRALYFFEVAIATPAQAISQIMVEAYKKYVLISMILHGKMQPLPKYVASIVTRFIKPLCGAYSDLVSAYSNHSSEKLREVLSKHHEVYVKDNNIGLTKQLFTSLYKRNIQRLTKTFLTLSLVDVANRCRLNGAAEAERYLLGMIEDGEIYATINQKDGMVCFHDNPEKFATADVMQIIEKELESSFGVHSEVKRLDLELLLNPQYVQKIAKQTAAASAMHEDEGVSVSASGSGLPEVYSGMGNF